MSLKLVICDDNKVDSDYLKDIVKKWARRRGDSLETAVFPSAEAFLFENENFSDIDIILLDIEMGEMDGVALAKRIRVENELIQIIFITGYSDYIAEGYEVSALHYLMKPVKEEKLLEVLDRAKEKLQTNEKTLIIENLGETERIPLLKIRYIDVQHNYITIHSEKELTVKMTLKDVMERLDDRFYRVGRSCIVNLMYITRVTKTDIILKDSETIPLPRGAYEGLNRAIINLT